MPPRFVRPSRPRFRCRWIAPHLNEGALLTERQNEVRGNGDTGAEASQALAEEARYQVSNRALHRCACPVTDFRAGLCGVQPSRYAPHSSAADGLPLKKNGCHLIMMASHGRRALGRLLLGSQVNEVLAHSKKYRF
jgi:hypothetical protein